MSVESRRQSAVTLLVLAGVAILAGAAVMSPAAALFCAGLAALAALAAWPLGSRRARVAALIVLVLAGAMGATAWPQYRAELQRMQ